MTGHGAGHSNGRRVVRLAYRRPYGFGDFQRNYLNYRTRRLIPSTDVVGENGELYYRTNAFGCRGEEPLPGRPAVAFMGDSVIHGFKDDWLAAHVDLPGLQSMNGGIEAQLLPWIVDRTNELFTDLRAAGIDLLCAAVHSGWHNICYNERGEDFWAAQFDRIDGPQVIAHFRLVADINEAAVREGYGQVFANVPGYQPWPGFDHESAEARQGFVEAIGRFNRFIEGYCRERGRVLIDLEPAAAPRTYADLGRNFLDFIHPSPTVYPAMARAIEAQLGPVVAAPATAGDQA